MVCSYSSRRGSDLGLVFLLRLPPQSRDVGRLTSFLSPLPLLLSFPFLLPIRTTSASVNIMFVCFSTLQRAVDYLRPSAGTDKPVQSIERTTIESLFRWAHELDEDVLDEKEVSQKGIRVEALDVEDESEESAHPYPEFFRPMSTKVLLTYRLSDEDEATQQRAASVPRMMKDLADMDDGGALDFFCVHLAWEFGVAIRSNIPKTEHGFGLSMEKISAWDFRE